MAAEVYEDSLELTVPILEAVLPDSEQYLASAYPYPSLRITGRMERRTFRTIVLENPYLRVVIVPDLGGRILRIFDKRTNTEIFPDEPLTPVEAGLRGVEIPHGIQILYTTQDRHNATGTVNYQLVHADDEQDDAGVWIGEVSGPLSFNALISMAPNAVEVKLELRMINRAIGDTQYNGGISIGMTNSESRHNDERYKTGIVLNSEGRGLLATCEQQAVAAIWSENDRLDIHRWAKDVDFTLAARQLDTWKFSLFPHGDLHPPILMSEVGVLTLRQDEIIFDAARVTEGHRLKVTNTNSESFEAPLHARPGQPLRLPFDDIASVADIAVLRPSNFHLIGFSRSEMPRPLGTLEKRPRDKAAELETKHRRELRAQLKPSAGLMHRLPTFRYEGYLMRAHGTSISKSTPEKMDGRLEQALLYNGEDHLAWCTKAMFKRLAGNYEEEAGELLNAHYLAPLEPMLRVEGFLSQPVGQGKEANPILRPLTESADQFVEAACQLLSWSQYADASRFIDEALRHNDLAMLRYLQAYVLTVGTKMEVEAAGHVRAASKLSFGPPFPWRHIEWQVLLTLDERFRGDERLKQYLLVAERYAS